MTGCILPGFNFSSWTNGRSLAPLGNVIRAHFHTMQTNGEASDVIMYRYEFVDNSAELTPYGKDHIAEIGARMQFVPFPVVVERSENNSNPELDEYRRQLVAQVLNDMGNQASQRTIVSQPYGNGINSIEGVRHYEIFLNTGDDNGNGGAGGGAGGGF